MICPNCSADNDAGAKFCNECGTPLAAGCPNCGATNKPGAKFCNECGTALTGAVVPRTSATAAPPQPDSAPVAERRLVTVLFADLVGFTPFAEERDAEEVRDTLSRYFDLCSEIVARYGGTIEKFIGDAVMAVWGAPTAHEDDAERAVRAALDLVGAVKQIAPNVQARAGVLTGEAAVTVGATNQGMVAGDMVNTASRLQSVAPPGVVLVGDATYRAASDAVQFEAAGPQLLKGKEAPVTAWRAVRVVAERGGRNRRAEGLEAPFVGRDDELQLLKDLLHATGRDRRVRLISVMGPGGIGKSRLTWEFYKYVDGLVEPIFWHSGRSPAYGEGVTFWALGEMVRGRAGLTENDDEATTRQKISATVDQFVRDESQRDWIERALLALLGVESGVPTDQLFGAWRSFFEQISAQGTVVLVFEDTHHADTGLLDFIDHMLDFSRGQPIYILTLARPELLDRRPDWGAGKRNFTSPYLDPLREPDMRELLNGLVPGLPEVAVRTIVERADGIPLYAVETVRMLVAEGRLKEESGFYVPVGDLTTLAVPETLTALISSRLDILDAADRALIHDAAVLGQSFAVEALASVSGRGVDEIERKLLGLVRRELLAREIDPRSAERGQFGFMQALIREVAYNTLSKKDRKARHLAAARYFEGLGSDELASALAGHYLAAHHNATEGPEADALAAQARLALRAASERAARLGAFEQAATFMEQAALVTADRGEAAEMLERAGSWAGIAAKHEKAGDLLRRAITFYLETGNRSGAASATAELGWDLLDAKQDASAQALFEQAASDYGDLWPDEAAVKLKTHQARAFVIADRSADALRTIEDALAAAERGDRGPLIARGMNIKGAALCAVGRLREGLALVRGAGSLAQELGRSGELLGSLLITGFYLGEIDNQGSLDAYREGLALAERVGHRAIANQFANNIGYTAFLVGDWDVGLRVLEERLAGDLDAGDRAWVLSNALIIRAHRGEDIESGLAELQRLVTEHGEPRMAVPTYDTIANHALAAGDFAEARRAWLKIATDSGQAPSSYYQAGQMAALMNDIDAVRADLAVIEAIGIHGKVIETRRISLRAALAAIEGRSTDAVPLFREALERWHELRLSWDEAITGITAVSTLEWSDKHVREIADTTGTILERLRAKPLQAQLGAAVERVHAPSGTDEKPSRSARDIVASETA